MLVPIITYERLERVTWKTPADQRNWEKDYYRLISLYGNGTFIIEAIHQKVGRQYLVLKNESGILNDRKGKMELFPASWVKRVEQGAA